MYVAALNAPVWESNPFSENEAERIRSDFEEKLYVDFYMDMLEKVKGMAWFSNDERLEYVFSHDTQSGGYRLSVFDKDGAIRHTARQSIKELFREEQFPSDGRRLTIVA